MFDRHLKAFVDMQSADIIVGDIIRIDNRGIIQQIASFWLFMRNLNQHRGYVSWRQEAT